MQNAWRLTEVVRRLFRHGWLGAVALVLTGFGVLMTPGDGVAKTPGKTYCFGGVCHRVLTLAETRNRVGKKTTAVTSYYGDCRSDRFNPCGLTSSGAIFRPSRADNAASPIYPNGTKLLVFNPRNGRAAVLRVNNAGPYKGRRTLDVSRGAATKLGFRHAGVARLIVKVVKAPTRAEARYRARRIYAPVPGYIGRFDSIGAALVASGYGGGRPEPSTTQLAGQVGDLLWARYAAMATPVLPVLVEPEPAPLPEQPSLAFKQQMRKLAMAERRRQAIERQRRERARSLDLAAAKAKQEAEERRRVAATARKRQQVARKPATANPASARARQAGAGAPNAQRAASAQGQQSPSANAQGSTATSSAPPQPKRRTVWRREIISIAQNSS
jgi:rare lipoprotein A